MNIIEDKLYSVKRFIKLYDDRNISETKILGEKIFNLCFSLMKNKEFPKLENKFRISIKMNIEISIANIFIDIHQLKNKKDEIYFLEIL